MRKFIILTFSLFLLTYFVPVQFTAAQLLPKKDINGKNEIQKNLSADLKYDWEPGEFAIMVGGNSRDVKSKNVNWAK